MFASPRRTKREKLDALRYVMDVPAYSILVCRLFIGYHRFKMTEEVKDEQQAPSELEQKIIRQVEVCEDLIISSLKY